jgi:spermidine synthase
MGHLSVHPGDIGEMPTPGNPFVVAKLPAPYNVSTEQYFDMLLPEVVEWNRQFLMNVNGALLNDRRVRVFTEDVFQVIRRAQEARYDAILLDVDNGPTSFVQARNAQIYSRRGFNRIANALQPGCRVAFWSATDEEAFGESLARAGFRVHVVEAKSHDRAKRFEHRIYVGETKPREREEKIGEP